MAARRREWQRNDGGTGAADDVPTDEEQRLRHDSDGRPAVAADATDDGDAIAANAGEQPSRCAPPLALLAVEPCLATSPLGSLVMRR